MMARRRAGVSSVLHMLRQIESGHALAAADHILIREPRNGLVDVILGLTDRLPEFLDEHRELDEVVFSTLIRIGLNLVGQDVKVARISSRVADKALSVLRERVERLQDSWNDSARKAVGSFLASMSSVSAGDSLPGYMGDQISKRLYGDLKPSSFIETFGSVALETVYLRMIEGRLCKFGNDYARGLEILRHLGFSQVSTNPVLAAKAFDEDSSLVRQLEAEISKNRNWTENPEEHGHQMAMAGTLLALWPNLEVFRPLAVLVGNSDYMVSFQLNPNVANDVKASLEDAKRAYKLARGHLAMYDRYLGVPNPGKLGPNIVFKVAGSSGAAREVTRKLNAAGIGTNNTVTYSVTQEVQLILDALEGKAKAVKSGRSVTRTYETNMGGRFVSHLREMEARRIFQQIALTKGETEATTLLMQIAAEIRLSEKEIERVRNALGIAEKVDLVCAFKNLKSLSHEAFLNAVEQGGHNRSEIEQLERDIRKAGTLVARRVYTVFYSKQNYHKWMSWLQRSYRIRRADAASILDSMDVLPASKRIPEDTFETLGSSNVCNTEFPNHAKAVQSFSQKSDFNLDSYRDAILQPADKQIVERLMRIEDFARGYECGEKVSGKLVEAGVLSHVDGLGLRGITEDRWHEFGPVLKTMAEFREAYEKLLKRCVEIARKQSEVIAQETVST